MQDPRYLAELGAVDAERRPRDTPEGLNWVWAVPTGSGQSWELGGGRGRAQPRGQRLGWWEPP